MNKIYKFKSISEATSHIGAVSPNVSYVVGSTNKVVYANFGNNKKIRFVNNNGVVTAEEATGLRFTAQQANSTVKLKKIGTLNTSYEYSTDNENWSSYTIGDVITLANIGDKVYFRGDNSRVTFSSSNYMLFKMTGVIAVGGNIMSMFDTIMRLTSIPRYGCYNMFSNCTSLTTAPELPATTLADYCYGYMFQGCTSLTIAPDLPATTLANCCYSGMFSGCRSLTIPPALPATTLKSICYSYMFQCCTSLTTAPELPATKLGSLCYLYMFEGCTSLTTAPELPATTLTLECYLYMFYGCTSLTSLTVYADDISASRCVRNWLDGINTTGTLHSLGSADFTGKVPSNWTIVQN